MYNKSLVEYYKAKSKVGKAVLKECIKNELGVSKFTARSYLTGQRRLQPKHFAVVERVTRGAVSEKKLIAELLGK